MCAGLGRLPDHAGGGHALIRVWVVVFPVAADAEGRVLVVAQHALTQLDQVGPGLETFVQQLRGALAPQAAALATGGVARRKLRRHVVVGVDEERRGAEAAAFSEPEAGPQPVAARRPAAHRPAPTEHDGRRRGSSPGSDELDRRSRGAIVGARSPAAELDGWVARLENHRARRERSGDDRRGHRRDGRRRRAGLPGVGGGDGTALH